MENAIPVKPIEIPRLPLYKKLLYYFGLMLFVVLMLVAYNGAEIRFMDLITYRENMYEYLKGFVTPDFLEWRLYLAEIWVTLQIALWGTFLAIIFSIPFGILSSANVVPVWVYQPVRRLMDVFRSVNEMIFAMLFIAAVGLGPFAGVLALFFHTLGTLSKLFSEAVEAIDPQPVEGIRATGASFIEEIVYGIIPQVIPLWISYSLYRFESNVRSASVVGMIGAGGIGMILWDAIRSFAYGQTAAIIILIVVSVTLLDILSSVIRKHFI